MTYTPRHYVIIEFDQFVAVLVVPQAPCNIANAGTHHRDVWWVAGSSAAAVSRQDHQQQEKAAADAARLQSLGDVANEVHKKVMSGPHSVSSLAPIFKPTNDVANMLPLLHDMVTSGLLPADFITFIAPRMTGGGPVVLLASNLPAANSYLAGRDLPPIQFGVFPLFGGPDASAAAEAAAAKAAATPQPQRLTRSRHTTAAAAAKAPATSKPQRLTRTRPTTAAADDAAMGAAVVSQLECCEQPPLKAVKLDYLVLGKRLIAHLESLDSKAAVALVALEDIECRPAHQAARAD